MAVMNRKLTVVAVIVLSVAFSAPLAFAGKPAAPGSPAAGAKPAGHAYGFYCQAESKAHVAGTPGTAFSKCVTSMAKLAKGAVDSPKAACANQSKKHVAGKAGTPFSICVAGGAKLLKDKSS
jgi:hypothetical protein